MSTEQIGSLDAEIVPIVQIDDASMEMSTTTSSTAVGYTFDTVD